MKAAPGELFCLVFVWNRRRRKGRPLRVLHLHWPRAGITTCELARDTVRERLESEGLP